MSDFDLNDKIFQVGGGESLQLYNYLLNNPIGSRVQFSVEVKGVQMLPVEKCAPQDATAFIFPASRIPLMGFLPFGLGILDGVFLVLPKKVPYNKAVEMVQAYLGFEIKPIAIRNVRV